MKIIHFLDRVPSDPYLEDCRIADIFWLNREILPDTLLMKSILPQERLTEVSVIDISGFLYDSINKKEIGDIDYSRGLITIKQENLRGLHWVISYRYLDQVP